MTSFLCRLLQDFLPAGTPNEAITSHLDSVQIGLVEPHQERLESLRAALKRHLEVLNVHDPRVAELERCTVDLENRARGAPPSEKEKKKKKKDKEPAKALSLSELQVCKME